FHVTGVQTCSLPISLQELQFLAYDLAEERLEVGLEMVGLDRFHPDAGIPCPADCRFHEGSDRVLGGPQQQGGHPDFLQSLERTRSEERRVGKQKSTQ